MAIITSASIAKVSVANKLTGEEFKMPTNAVASIKQFNFVVSMPDEINPITGKTMPGATVLTVQLGTKATVDKPIEFAKEMSELQEAMLTTCDTLETAFMAVLSASTVTQDKSNRNRLSISLPRLRATFGLE